MFIPSRFKRAVALHVVKNLLRQEHFRAPLLLGIHGASGEGKTYQCEQVLQEMGVRAFLISGGQLESHEAGEPAKMLRDTYLNAGRAVEKGECRAAVVLINDVDTGLGNWGETVQYTINRQTVFGELMHLVDYPTRVEGRETNRVPVILTGNDFTKLYEPLVRAGRMHSFVWHPTLEEKALVVSDMFPELSPKLIRSLLSELDVEARALLGDRHTSLSVAFFSHLRASLFDDTLWNAIERVGLEKIVGKIAGGSQPRLAAPASYEQFVEEGKKLIKAGHLINHLRS